MKRLSAAQVAAAEGRRTLESRGYAVHSTDDMIRVVDRHRLAVCDGMRAGVRTLLVSAMVGLPVAACLLY